MIRRLVLAALALASFGVIAVAQAQDKWVRLAAREIDLAKDSATIDVEAVKGSFKAIRLEARRGDVLITNVDVKYADKKSHQERRRINLLEGDRSRPINPDDDRFIDSVVLSYESNRSVSRPTLLEIWGLQSPAGEKAARGKGGDPAVSNVQTTPTSPVATDKKPGELVGAGEVLFGAQRVGFGVDRDVVQVGAEVGLFDRIRLRVLENDIFIRDLTVIYANGEKDQLVVNADIKRDTRTQWFPLKGDRFIKEIQFTYRSRTNFRGLARVEVSGEYAEGWLGPKGKGRNFNQGWVLLGAQTAGFLGFDNDLVPVGKNEGGFRKIRVNVKDRAITLDQIRVIYADGKEDQIPVARQKVEAGGVYGPVDIKGQQGIKEVRMRYRSRFIDRAAAGKGAAIVEVWGQH
jgi:hypothetical protein